MDILEFWINRHERKGKNRNHPLTQHNKYTGVPKMENINPCRLAAMIERVYLKILPERC